LQCVGFATPSAVDAFGSVEECVGTLGVAFGPGQLVTGGEPQCGVGGVTALENQFWDSRKACAFSGPPEPGTATIEPTCDVSTAMVPTTRTPRPGAGLVEEPTAAGVVVAATARATAVTLSSRPRTGRLPCVPETARLPCIADLDHRRAAWPRLAPGDVYMRRW